MKEQRDEQLSLPPDGRSLAEQPKWRQDFPIDWPEDHYVSRRDFTKFMVLTSFAFVIGQVWIALQNFFRTRRGEPAIRQIARADQMPIGGALIFEYPAPHDTCLLLRLNEQEFVAYSQKCTHLSCAVVPQLESNRLYCPCHEGAFDLASGAPTAGPPQRPLPRIKLEIYGDAIYASAVELRTT